MTVNTEYNFITGLNGPVGITTDTTNIYVTNIGTNSVGKYLLDGTVVNPSLITGLSIPVGITINGNNFYITNNSTNSVSVSTDELPCFVKGTKILTNKGYVKIEDLNKDEHLVETFKNGSKKNPAGAKFLESIGKNDDKHMMDLALK